MKKRIALILGLLVTTTLFSCGASGGGNNSTPPPNNDGGNQSTNDQIYSGDDRKIIYTVSYTISLDDEFDKITNQIEDKVYELNGYISKSNESTSYYSYTYKIPVNSLNDFLSFMDKNGDTIESKTITSKDVTSSYNKLAAEISTLEASKLAYEKILQNEELTYSDIITINKEINNINSELTYLYGQLDSMKEKTDYATVEITFRNCGGQENNPFMEYLNYLKNLGIMIINFIVYTLPFALISGLIILIIYLVKRKRSKTTS